MVLLEYHSRKKFTGLSHYKQPKISEYKKTKPNQNKQKNKQQKQPPNRFYNNNYI